MLAYKDRSLPEVEIYGIRYSKCSSSFNERLTERLVKASQRSGVTINFLRGDQLGFVILCIEKGREEDFWAAFK